MDNFDDTMRDSVNGGEGPSAAFYISSEGIESLELRLNDRVDVVEVEYILEVVLLRDIILS